jgi:hypothetical protein
VNLGHISNAVHTASFVGKGSANGTESGTESWLVVGGPEDNVPEGSWNELKHLWLLVLRIAQCDMKRPKG